MAYRLFFPSGLEEHEHGLGEYWRHASAFEEHMKLCEVQTTARGILADLPPRSRVLDAGCGLGRWVKWLNDHGHDACGVDVSADALRIAKHHLPDLELAVADVRALPFPDGCFDAVLSMGVLEHFEEGPQEGLEEARRVLRPGGLLFLSLPYEGLMRRFVHRPHQAIVRTLRRLRGVKEEFDEYRYSHREVQGFLRQSGFEPVRVDADDFIRPFSLGLYTDWYRYLADRRREWRLNPLGRMVARLLSVSKWSYPAGILVVARRPAGASERNSEGEGSVPSRSRVMSHS